MAEIALTPDFLPGPGKRIGWSDFETMWAHSRDSRRFLSDRLPQRKLAISDCVHRFTSSDHRYIKLRFVSLTERFYSHTDNH
jgi:hypothetical protein